MIEAASVGVPSDEVALTGVGETSTGVMGVATRTAGKDGLEMAGACWPVEVIGSVVELLGSKDSVT